MYHATDVQHLAAKLFCCRSKDLEFNAEQFPKTQMHLSLCQF